jgi:hypothetical protein
MSYDVTFNFLTKLYQCTLTFSITLQHHTQAIKKVLHFFHKNLWFFNSTCFGFSSNSLLSILILIHLDINKCWNIVPRVANWLRKLDGIIFSALGPTQGHKVQHLLVTWADWIFFFLLALTPSVKPLGPISTFTQIGMLDLVWTSALTPSVKPALLEGRNVPNPVRNLACLIFSLMQQQDVG